jgi:hypothetical protein
MRPKILQNYKNEDLSKMLSNSKSGELWIVRFVPFLWNDFNKCNAVSIYKKKGIFKKETLTNEEYDEMLVGLSAAGYENLRMVKNINQVILFYTLNDSDGALKGIKSDIKTINKSIQVVAGVCDIDKDRCCIVKNKSWELNLRPKGFYTIEDLH